MYNGQKYEKLVQMHLYLASTSERPANLNTLSIIGQVRSPKIKVKYNEILLCQKGKV